MTPKIAQTFTIVFLLLSSSGCSVFMAASGGKDPDLEKIKPGISRIEAEAELGIAAETKKTSSGSTSSYVYKTGDEPSLGRAAGYLVGDIFTLCLAEYIFWPLEISNGGEPKELIVTYDGADKVVKIAQE